VTTAPGVATQAQIGLLGGSFDPVHNAHLALARSAIETLALDTLLWIPTGKAWQKARALTPAPHRIAMLRLAIADDKRQRIDTCEVDREGPSYMIDTVLELQGRSPNARLWLLLGQDQFSNLPTWHRWRELVSRVGFAVANRGGVAAVAPAELLAAGATVVEVPLAPMTISSTEIRQRVAEGLSVTSLVPAAVARYIVEHKLYRNPHRS
jgi:nicotinate-nucleotide adenylyltransferase